VPQTEARIQQLCREVLSAETEAEAERVIPELREVLQEHLRLAKASLKKQAIAVAALDTTNPAGVVTE